MKSVSIRNGLVAIGAFVLLLTTFQNCGDSGFRGAVSSIASSSQNFTDFRAVSCPMENEPCQANEQGRWVTNEFGCEYLLCESAFIDGMNEQGSLARCQDIPENPCQEGQTVVTQTDQYGCEMVRCDGDYASDNGGGGSNSNPGNQTGGNDNPSNTQTGNTTGNDSGDYSNGPESCVVSALESVYGVSSGGRMVDDGDTVRQIYKVVVSDFVTSTVADSYGNTCQDRGEVPCTYHMLGLARRAYSRQMRCQDGEWMAVPNSDQQENVRTSAARLLSFESWDELSPKKRWIRAESLLHHLYKNSDDREFLAMAPYMQYFSFNGSSNDVNWTISSSRERYQDKVFTMVDQSNFPKIGDLVGDTEPPSNNTGGNDNPSSGGGNDNGSTPAPNFEADITRWFNTYLGRAPEQEGLQEYLRQLNDGRNPAHVENEIANSYERQIRDIYKAHFFEQGSSDEPDRPGMIYWVGRANEGLAIIEIKRHFQDHAKCIRDCEY